jgi:hypothetical protein
MTKIKVPITCRGSRDNNLPKLAITPPVNINPVVTIDFTDVKSLIASFFSVLLSLKYSTILKTAGVPHKIKKLINLSVSTLTVHSPPLSIPYAQFHHLTNSYILFLLQGSSKRKLVVVIKLIPIPYALYVRLINS